MWNVQKKNPDSQAKIHDTVTPVLSDHLSRRITFCYFVGRKKWSLKTGLVVYQLWKVQVKNTGTWGMDFVSSSPLFSTPPPFFQKFYINHSFFKIFIIIRFSSFDNISRRHTSWIMRVFCVHSFSVKRGRRKRNPCPMCLW